MEFSKSELEYLKKLESRNLELEKKYNEKINEQDKYWNKLANEFILSKNRSRDEADKYYMTIEKIKENITKIKKLKDSSLKQGLQIPMTSAERKMRQRIRQKIQIKLKELEFIGKTGLYIAKQNFDNSGGHVIYFPGFFVSVSQDSEASQTSFDIIRLYS